MAQTSLVSYLHNVSICINDKDGVGLAECVSFKHPHVSNPRLRLEQPEADVQRMIDPPWDELVAGHLRACWAISVEDYIEAYTTQTYALQAILKVIQQQKDENWQLPVMYDVILDLRYFANLADKQQRKKSVGRPGDVLEKAAEQIMGCFRACVTDTRAEIRVSKRWAMLPITNQLLKIYFKINKLHLCKPLITAIENSDLRDHFSSAQQVTFRYFVGRKAMFDGDYRTADEYLSYAFSQCHRFSKNNKRRILTYLLPVKMLLGHMPKVALLHKYDLMQFADVANAVRTGNLLQFNEALSQHEGFFIRCGVYLILEKLKIHTYRNLFKKVYLIMKTHQLPIDIFVDALTLMKEVDIDNDECQCILANLIYENRIKGYISHQHNKLVVSKQNPFPSLVNQ